MKLTKFEQLCEEVSTYLDSENKLKNNSETDSTTDTSSSETAAVEMECCEGGAGIDVGSVMGPGTPETSLAELATKEIPTNTYHKGSVRY